MTALFAACDKIGNSEKNNPYKALDLSTKSAEFAQLGNAFSLEYIHKIDAQAKGGYIVSPLSMQILLGMVLDGAQGQTADEICTVLGYGQGEKEAVDQFCLSMMEQLPKLDKKTTVSIANALFVDKGFPIRDAYKSNVSKYYLAQVANLDFSNVASSLKTINGWCSKNTNGMIPKVLDDLDPNIPVYLMDALYFKGQWQKKFQKGKTSSEEFTTESGGKAQVQMMKQNEQFRYEENDIYQAVDLPYGNGAFRMLVYLPRSGYGVADVIDFLKSVPGDRLQSYMITHEVDLWLPKFETKSHFDLKEILSAMGMPLAFNTSMADFSLLSGYPLYLAYVMQDAIIKVDESGTEAAAVSTAAFGKMAAEPNPPAIFHADHPFLYLITEKSTGVILFAGKYGGQ